MSLNFDISSPERQAFLRPYEAADRSMVGFSMEYPSGLSTEMHSHPRAQVIYAISGVMRIETAEAVFVLPPSMALILPAHLAHAVTMEGPVALRQIFLGAPDDPGHAAPRVISVSPLLRQLILSMCAEPLDWDEHGRAHHIVGLIRDEIARAPILPTQLLLPLDGRAHRVAQEVLARPGDPRTLEDWAEVAGASARTLERLFRAETGLTFGQWRLQARLNAAFVLLMGDRNLKQIAEAVGFRGQSAFGAAFRNGFGLTPGQARRLYKRDRD